VRKRGKKTWRMLRSNRHVADEGERIDVRWKGVSEILCASRMI
jgi:hypothetical protein